MILLLCLLLQDAACITCHTEADVEIKGSVHEKTGCVGCHGTDEVKEGQTRGNPHRKLETFKSWRGRNLTADCGSCHTGILEELKRSTHDCDTRNPTTSMKKGCIECHGYHGVLPASRSAIFNECRRCHDPASIEHERGRRLVQDLDQLDGFISQAELRLRDAQGRPGLSSGDLSLALARAKRSLDALAVAQHGLKFGELKKTYDAASEPLHASYYQLERDEEVFRGRWKWLAPFLVFAGLFAAAVVLRRKEKA